MIQSTVFSEYSSYHHSRINELYPQAMQAVVKWDVGTFSQTRMKELSHQEVDEWSVRVYFALINFFSFQSWFFIHYKIGKLRKLQEQKRTTLPC